MALKLVIGDVVEVPVKFEVQDAGRDQVHQFKLVCRREPQEKLEGLSAAGLSASAFMSEVTTAWKGQNVVVDDATGQPAEFSTESLALLFSVAGLASVAFASYLAAVGARVKN